MFPLLFEKMHRLMLTCLLVFSASQAAEPGQSFRVILLSQVDMDIPGASQKIDAKTELYYTWQQTKDERVLSFDSLMVQAHVNGKAAMDSFVSRDKFIDNQNGDKKEISFEKAPEALKAHLRDTYGAPICKIQVDQDGRELHRQMVAGPGARTTLDQGIFAMALLFHSPFPKTQHEWSAPAEISMGNGGFVKGDLHYKKAADGRTVAVKGTLTLEKQPVPGGSGLVIRNAVYEMAGDQLYDPEQNTWVSGNLRADISFKMTNGDAPLATAKGKIDSQFKKVSAPGQP
jgi:hypothetical protein